VARITAPALASAVGASPRITLRLAATTAGGTSVRSYEIQDLDLSAKHGTWQTLAVAVTGSTFSFTGTAGHTYEFRVAATDSGGEVGAFATSGAVVVPSGAKPSKGHYSKHWKTVKVKGAWQGHAIESSTAGSTFTLRYTGGTVTVIGETSRSGGRLKVTLDGHSRTLRLHSSKLAVRKRLATFKVKSGTHHLKLTVLSGTVAVEGYAIADRTG
jgi:hypothetical protein